MKQTQVNLFPAGFTNLEKCATGSKPTIQPASQQPFGLEKQPNKSGHAFWWRVEMALLTTDFPLAILAPVQGRCYLFFLRFFILIITQSTLILSSDSL